MWFVKIKGLRPSQNSFSKFVRFEASLTFQKLHSATPRQNDALMKTASDHLE
jgi:hypothetical protein